MRMRIGAAHDSALVFEYLNPAVALRQFGDLLGPHVHDFADIRHWHFGEGQVVARGEANDATFAASWLDAQ